MIKRANAIQWMIAFFMAMLCVVGLVSWLNYQSSSQLIMQMTEQTTKDAIDQSSAYLATYIQKVKTATNVLTQDRSIVDYAKDDSTQPQRQAEQLIENVLATDPFFVAAVLVTKDGRVLSNDQQWDMSLSQNMMQEAWYQAAIASAGTPVLTSARKQQLAQQTSEWVISVTQEVRDEHGANLGVLRMDISYQALASYLDQLNLGANGYAFIMNELQQFVYHPDPNVYTQTDAMAEMAQLAAQPDGFLSQEQYIYHVAIDNTDWTLVGVASLESWQMNRQQLLTTTIIGALLVCFVALAGTVWVIQRWLRPLAQLQTTMQLVESGEREHRAQVIGAVEMQSVAQHFNRMLDTINRLMNDVQEQELAARRYELMALASQINPHFLYNTLDTIIWMAEFNDSSRVVALTKALANYFRLALNQGEPISTLSNELAHVREYLFIQQMRYGEQLQYDVQEMVSKPDFRLPKLVLQPIVENALYHGIKGLDRTGQIDVRVIEKANELCVIIKDNGRGMPQDMVAKAIGQRLGGVGIQNVIQRLELYFGDQFHYTIESKPDQFTQVTFYLPKELRKEH